ncbi:hypothetical protein AB4480_08865 [Vibrio sp. 10N.261.45.A4]|uniref:hypothetical protein n=2 Tax=unclassified Vibrio TaxID=2614977 RepID=UPI003550247A
MAQYAFLSTKSKDEIEYYWFRSEREFGRRMAGRDRFENQPLLKQLEHINRLLLEERGYKHAVILGAKWRIDYEIENDADEDIFEWIDTPRISGFCFMMIDFNKRDFTKLPSSPNHGSLSELKPNDLQNADANKMLIFNNTPRGRILPSQYKENPNSFSAKLKAQESQKPVITNTISAEHPSPIVLPVSSDADTHKKRRRKIINYLNDALNVTRGGLSNDAFRLILNLKYSWQNIYVYNDALNWVDDEDEEQVKWLQEEIVKEFGDKFVLPWISTSTTKLYQSLITYMDIQWHYNLESTISICDKLKKAWGRRQKNKEKSNGLLSLTAKTNSQLLELETELQKSSKAIIKSLVEDKYQQECT